MENQIRIGQDGVPRKGREEGKNEVRERASEETAMS
jgi:hypothetical protein